MIKVLLALTLIPKQTKENFFSNDLCASKIMGKPLLDVKGITVLKIIIWGGKSGVLRSENALYYMCPLTEKHHQTGQYGQYILNNSENAASKLFIIYL